MVHVCLTSCPEDQVLQIFSLQLQILSCKLAGSPAQSLVGMSPAKADSVPPGGSSEQMLEPVDLRWAVHNGEECIFMIC